MAAIDFNLRCFRGSGGVLDYDTASTSLMTGSVVSCSVDIYNRNGSLLAGPFHSISGSVTKISAGGTDTWTFDPAHADVIASTRLSRQFDEHLRFRFTETVPSASSVADVWVTVNNQDKIASDYPNKKLFCDGFFGDNNASYATPEFGNASKLNPTRQVREMSAMAPSIGSTHYMIVNQVYGVRTDTFTGVTFEGDPLGAIVARGGNTLSLDNCYFKNMDLRGFLGGTYDGTFTVDGGKLQTGFKHANGVLTCVNEVGLEGDIDLQSTTIMIGDVKGTAAVIDCSAPLTDLILGIDKGDIQLDNLDSGMNVSITGVGGTLKLPVGNANPASVKVGGYIIITDDSDVPWDNQNNIGGCEITASVIASRTNVLTNLPAQQGPGQWDTTSSLTTSSIGTSVWNSLTSSFSTSGSAGEILINNFLLAGETATAMSGTAAGVWDALTSSFNISGSAGDALINSYLFASGTAEALSGTAADVWAVQSSSLTVPGSTGMMLTNISSSVNFIEGIEGGRWKIISNQMIFYGTDNTTEIARFNLLDDLGAPTTASPFERVRT